MEYFYPSSGYPLSPEAFKILFNRFATKRKYMKLDDFAACLSRMKIMNGNMTVNGRLVQLKCCYLLY